MAAVGWGTFAVAEELLQAKASAEAKDAIGQRALSALPADQREAVLLCSVEGFTPAEAASIAGVSPATLRKRLSRGRQALRKLIR